VSSAIGRIASTPVRPKGKEAPNLGKEVGASSFAIAPMASWPFCRPHYAALTRGILRKLDSGAVWLARSDSG
jgi:hypothetical protein